MKDYNSYIGRDFCIVKPLYEDTDTQQNYDPDDNPPWNVVGNILTITGFIQRGNKDGSFFFRDVNGKVFDSLFIYDFENGFLAPYEEPDCQIDSEAIINLL